MKTIKGVMLLLGIIFLSAACLPSPATPGLELEVDAQDPWQTYTSDKYQLSLQFPPGWQVLELPTPEYPGASDQVWLYSEALPLPQTGSRADIVLIFTQEDPSAAWESQYFDDYQIEDFQLGELQARKISGIHKESGSPETVVLAKVGENYLQVLPNQGEISMEYFDQVISSIRFVPAQAAAPLTASTPSLLPSPTQPPVLTPETGAGQEVIDPGSAGLVLELAKLGKGTILSHPFDAPEGMPVFSPDGAWMAIPTSAGIYIYDASSWEELHRIPVGTPFIAFSPDSRLLVTGGTGSVRLWDPATGLLMSELPGRLEEGYWELSFSLDGSLLSATTAEREIAVWSLLTFERLFTLPGDRLRFSPDGKLAVTTIYGENRIHLYETQGGSEVNMWNARHAGFSPGGQLWMEVEQTVRLVYPDRDQVTAPFSGVQPAFSADGSLMSLFANGQVSVYDHQRGRRTQALEGSFAQIDGVLFSPDGQTLAGAVYSLHCPTCSEIEGLDRSLVIWRAADGSILARLEQDLAGWMAYSPDGSLLAIFNMENVQIVKAADGTPVMRIDGFTNPAEGMALSPDGKTLAAAYATDDDYTLRFWDLESGSLTRELHEQQGPALINVEAAYSPDGKYLAVGGVLWDLSAGERLTRLEQVIGEKTSCWPSSVAFSPVENTLATGCFDGQLDLWSVPSGEHLESTGGYQGWVYALAYSPDGDRLAAVYWVPDHLVQVWEMPDGTASITLTGGDFSRVSFSPDGQTLATVAINNEYGQYGWQAGFVQMWSASDGEELARLELEDAVSIAFSPDGRILATGSLDGTLRLWEISGSRLLMEVNGHYRSIQRLAFTSDGTRLVSSSPDGTISVWGISNPPLP